MSEQDQYKLPEAETVYLDSDKNEVVKEDDLTPWLLIKSLAEKMGTIIREPRSNCKDCYGRGYIGFRPKKVNSTKAENVSLLSKEPVPCPCIFTAEQKENDRPLDMNRKQKRLMEKRFKKMKKRGQLKRRVEEKTDG